MTAARTLLAKSTQTPERPEEWCTLTGHISRAVDAAQAIVDEGGAQVLAAFGLDQQVWGPRCLRAVSLAALAHDLGKANDHFQQMVRGGSTGPAFRQGHRHELLSFWLVADGGPLHDWLLGEEEEVVNVAVLTTIVGHHLKFETPDAFRYSDGCSQPRQTLWSDHVDFTWALTLGMRRLGLGEPPRLRAQVFNVDGPLSDDTWPALCRLVDWARRCGRDDRVFVAVARSLFVAADVVSSFLARSGDRSAASWVKQALNAVPRPEDLRRVATLRLEGRDLRPFQLEVARASEPVTLVRAGCGSGKTVAAYLWAAERASGRKLFFTYPTTGTATEGFATYVADAEIEAGLFHSKARVDLQLLVNGDESAPDLADRWAETTDALALWLPDVAVSTADVILGLVQNYRTALFAFPALGAGAFVFDEAHQYDDRMFAALCRFVEEGRGMQVLIMTATMPPAREEALAAAVQARGGTLRVVDGPAEVERGARYDIERTTRDEALARALEVLAAGGKVLWVCNTVERAINTGRDVGAAVELPTYVYHSRFRYEDRATRHREVVAAFAATRPVAAVTTQVCEVSLDLSADLLVSDVAPVPAMIQRLGRLNRRFDPQRPSTRLGVFLDPNDFRPYNADSLDEGNAWLTRVVGLGRSQRDLTDAFSEVAATRPRKEGGASRTEAVWLDRIPFAYPAALRDVEPSIAVLLPEDADACRTHGGKVDVVEIVRRAIPMPCRREVERWERLGMAVVAPPGRIQYSVAMGAQWAQVDVAR